jgi:hypothetical protein
VVVLGSVVRDHYGVGLECHSIAETVGPRCQPNTVAKMPAPSPRCLATRDIRPGATMSRIRRHRAI